jgi:hypothetical protein
VHKEFRKTKHNFHVHLTELPVTEGKRQLPSLQFQKQREGEGEGRRNSYLFERNHAVKERDTPKKKEARG